MRNFNKKLVLTILLSLTFVFTLQTIFVSAPPAPQYPPSILYQGVVYNGDNTYTFTYAITSGNPAVKKWQLYSPCFKHDGPEVTVEAEDITYGVFTPDWSMNSAQHYIEFKHESKQQFVLDLTRVYRITLHIGSYIPLPVGEVDYTLHWPPGTEVEGKITGPICPPDLVIDESPLGTLGIIIPLGAAIGLFGLYSRKMLFVTKV